MAKSSWNDILDAGWYTIKDTASDLATAAGGAVNSGWNYVTGNSNLPPDPNLGQSRYNFNYLTFPETLGNQQYNHYMVININVPVNNAGQPRGNLVNTDIIPDQLSKVDVMRFGPSSGTPGSAESLTLNRGTRRIASSIALFMPGPMMFIQEHRFSDFKVTHMLGSGVGLTGGGPNLAQFFGHPINPRVEVLYSHTELRGFQFAWLMSPETESESIAMKNIISLLRFHSAPELEGGTGGMTFIPPAEFDITFYKDGVENTNVPRINTCVLEEISVDYTPLNDQWVTFSNGHPVAAYITLKFREVEILHKRRIYDGF